MVLISDLSEQTEVRYLKLQLTGTTSNRSGLFARATVVAGERRYTKRLDGKSGYLSQSLMPLYFGLGSAELVDRIDITWPSGKTQTIEGPIQTNQLVPIEEPR